MELHFYGVSLVLLLRNASACGPYPSLPSLMELRLIAVLINGALRTGWVVSMQSAKARLRLKSAKRLNKQGLPFQIPGRFAVRVLTGWQSTDELAS